MTSRRRRPHYRPAAIGYRASRWKARLPRQAGLTGVHLCSELRFASGFHPTRPRGEGPGCAMPAKISCSCLRLLVASNGPHKGLTPSIIHPCPTHLRFGILPALAPTARLPGHGQPLPTPPWNTPGGRASPRAVHTARPSTAPDFPPASHRAAAHRGTPAATTRRNCGSCRSRGRRNVRWIGGRGRVENDFGVGRLCNAQAADRLELSLLATSRGTRPCARC